MRDTLAIVAALAVFVGLVVILCTLAEGIERRRAARSVSPRHARVRAALREWRSR